MAERRVAILRDSALRERNILRNVYLWMTGGLGLTGVIAWGVSSNPDLMRAIVANQVIFFGLIIVELLLVVFLSAKIQTISPGTAILGFTLYSGLNGITLSIILLAYTGTTIASTLFITAATFAGTAFYAYTTKRDLSSIGHYLLMGLWGIIIASLVNLFLRSDALYWIVSYAGVALFIGLTRIEATVS